ncbi:MAG: putative toxin-antitoxin system toxin component, PIN family [Actinobacteria bacterium]|nr:putative toxin-antitoxin system toxin component, PIN family [Actinomycetota bacterium]
MYKAVFDTNIYVSAAAFGGKLEILFRLSWSPHRQFKLYTSNDILKETVRVLASDKFQFTRDEIADAVASIIEAADVVEPKTKISVVSDEPDNRILECAIKTMADYLVSGDAHLLDLKEYKGIRILKPAQFLALLEKER